MLEIRQPAVNDDGRYLRTIGKGLEKRVIGGDDRSEKHQTDCC